MQITTDGTLRVQVNSLAVDVYGEIVINTGELRQFYVMDGPTDITAILEQLNSDLLERLRDKLIAKLLEDEKPEGADL